MNLTAVILIAVFLVLIGLDVAFAEHWIKAPTISMDIRDFAAKSPWFVIALGFLLGHLVWPQPPAK